MNLNVVRFQYMYIYIILIKSTSEFFTYKELFNHNSVVDVNSKYVHKQERKKRKKNPRSRYFQNEKLCRFVARFAFYI